MAEPKSAAGVRTLGINGLARGALRAERARQTVQRLDGLIFTTDAGEPLNDRVVTWAFGQAIKRAGVRPVRFHDCRHACATLLLTAGEDLEVISRVLGHSDLGTTLRVYAHLDPKRARTAANRIDGALGRAALG
jgi:integrase